MRGLSDRVPLAGLELRNRLVATAHVQAIGDAVTPRRVAHAIAEGRAAAEAILRVERNGRS